VLKRNKNWKCNRMSLSLIFFHSGKISGDPKNGENPATNGTALNLLFKFKVILLLLKRNKN
jgi:hypothetical protein